MEWSDFMCILMFAGVVTPTSSAELNKPSGVSYERETPFVRREFKPFIGSKWIGNGVAYGPHRDGQSPNGASPSKSELREDLRIMSEHWNLIRMYNSRAAAEAVLQLIRDERMPMKVMVGVWIGTETKLADDGTVAERFPETIEANRAEVEAAIRLANTYPDIIAAISVGNETHVSWSFHPVRTETLVNHLRHIRAETKVPVTTADNFSFWCKPESKALSRELDFIVTHIYAMWNKQPFENAMSFTKEKYAEVAAANPHHQIVIGEAGWATQKHNQGDQSWLIVGKAGEDQQKLFFNEFTTWTRRERIANFFFEAFDENWKGGSHPNEVEKHWGLFRADRTPKTALRPDK